jgi:GNAT superfamily N-acetyltransferase
MMKTQFNGYVFNDDIEAIDFRKVTDWLAGTYWSPRITQTEVEKGARNSSLVIGTYDALGNQVGYARLVSDKTRFAYIMDVFVDAAHRRKGLAGAMIRFARTHPDHRDVYQWLLATQDAHPVYEKLGFKPLTHPERWMMIRDEKSRINS